MAYLGYVHSIYRGSWGGLRALMSCVHQDQDCTIGLILGKFTISSEGVGWGSINWSFLG